MEELKRMEAALLAAEKAGDVDAAKAIAGDMMRVMQRSNPSLGMPEPRTIGRDALPKIIQDFVKQEDKSDQVLMGAGSAAVLAREGTRGLAGYMNPQTVAEQKAIRDASPMSQLGNVGGNVAMFSSIPTRGIASAASGISGMLGKAAPAALQSRPAVVLDTALTAGLLNAATEPGSVSERAQAGILSAGVSSAAPGLYATGAGARRMMTRGGKRVSVGEGILAEAGDENADRIIASLRQPDPVEGILGVRNSSAVRSGNPTIEALESGSRVQRGDLWRNFDTDNASARWDALRRASGTPEELAGMKATRDNVTGAMRDEALSNANTTAAMTRGSSISDEMLSPFQAKVNEYRTGGLRPNRDVQTLANWLEGEIKQGVTPEQLYEMRKALTDGVKAGRNDELSNAIKASRAQRMELVKMIDENLNTLSGGFWGDYMKRYSKDSLPITSKQALLDVVTALERGQPLGEVPSAMGNSWKTVGNLRDRFGQKEIGGRLFDRMTPEDRQVMNALVDNLKRQSDVMTTRATIGSPTAGLLANAGRASGITQGVVEMGANRAVPLGGMLVSGAFDRFGRKAEEELAKLLQDPDALVQAILSAQNARRIAGASSRVGAGSGAAYQQ